MTDNEICLVWEASMRVPSPFGEMFRILLLTGQRRDEVAQMRWSELDLEGATWLLPAQRSKNRKPHAVPLSDTALTIIKNLSRVAHPATGERSDFVFTTTGHSGVSGYSKAKARLDLEIEKVAAPTGLKMPVWRLHDLRRTVASGMARLGQPIHIVEAVLNHRSGTISGIAAVYIRHEFAEEKRRALQTWSEFTERLTTSKGKLIEADPRST
ncbi:site-specific integrase [Tabrizicola sp. BL-A-41-H6]|uniref:site-specific integrase n=1 Tax=Tabrizicola sp. BL-A-41-H6 TaxID=3421107 RepID=UPI003D66D032